MKPSLTEGQLKGILGHLQDIQNRMRQLSSECSTVGLTNAPDAAQQKQISKAIRGINMVELDFDWEEI